MFRHLKIGAAALTLGAADRLRRRRRRRGGTAGTIEYWLWDSGQQPGYQKCADAFQQQNPGLRIHISQYGWDDYWSKLTAGFIADTAPDVFTDHLAKYAQFVDLEVLRPLDDLRRDQRHPGRRLPGGSRRALEGPGRQTVRRAEGLGHHRDLLRRRPSSRPPASTRPSCRTWPGTRRTAAPSRRWSPT